MLQYGTSDHGAIWVLCKLSMTNHRTSNATNNCVVQWAQICCIATSVRSCAMSSTWCCTMFIACWLCKGWLGTFGEEIVSWWLLGFSKYFCSELMGILVSYWYFVW
jgi:hypothetical protein